MLLILYSVKWYCEKDSYFLEKYIKKSESECYDICLVCDLNVQKGTPGWLSG